MAREIKNLVGELDTDPLISVKTQNPLVARFLRGKVFLIGVTLPVPDKNPCAAALCDFAGLVGTSRVHDQNLVAAGKAGDRFGNALY